MISRKTWDIKLEVIYTQTLTGRKILMIIACQRFRDEELLIPKNKLEQSGATVTIASSSLMTANGALGTAVKPDIPVDKVMVDAYDAVIFVGGPGATEYFHDPKAHAIAIDAVKSNKVLGAICLAPSILANAGVLSGKKATAFVSEENNLIQKGANFTGNPVESDGNLITADGPQSANKFAESIIKALT